MVNPAVQTEQFRYEMSTVRLILIGRSGMYVRMVPDTAINNGVVEMEQYLKECTVGSTVKVKRNYSDWTDSRNGPSNHFHFLRLAGLADG